MSSPDATTELTPEQRSVINRLRRAEGQLSAVIRMVEEGRDCRDTITQMSAVAKAIDRAGFALIAGNMQECLTDAGEDREAKIAELEKAFLSLA